MGVQISGDTGNVLATKGTYTGNLTVGGVLTYEDVTNVDSVGLVTARSGIEIGARPGVAASISVDGNMIVSGISTFGGALSGTTGTFSGDVKTTAATVNVKSGTSINTNSDTSAHGALHKNTNSGEFAVVSGGTGGNNHLTFYTSASAAPTEKLRISSTGQLLHKHNASIGLGRDFQTSSTSGYGGIAINRFSADIGSGGLDFVKSRNASLGGNTIVQSDDNIGAITWRGADGTDFETPAAQIKVAVDGTPGSNDMPGRIMFYTTADGASSVTERLRIASDGKIGFGDFSSGTSLSYPLHLKNAMGSSPSFIHMEVTGSNTVGGGGGIAFDTSASSNTSSNTLYLATIAGIRNSDDDGSNDLVFSTSKNGVNSDLPSEKLRITSGGSLQVPIGSNIEIGQIASSNHADGNAGSVLLGIQDGGGAMSGVKVTNVDAGTYNDQIVTFLTAQGGVSTPTERLRIRSTGVLQVNTTTEPGGDPSGGGSNNSNGFLHLMAANSENAMSLTNATTIANNAARGTVLTGINFLNRNYYGTSGRAGTGYVVRNEKGHASYMDRCDLRFVPGYDGQTLYTNRSVVFEFDGVVRPGDDDYASLGKSSAKWTALHATNGTIQTSDENLKQNIQSLSTAEMNAAARISKLFITYKWKKKVAKESAGGDAARIHTGVIAQQVKAALEAEGLTAANYSFWCEDITWKDSEGNIAGDGRISGPGVYDELTGTTPSTDGYTKTVQYAVRYDELLSFVSAYNEQRFTSIESRLDAAGL